MKFQLSLEAMHILIFVYADELLQEVDFPVELIANTSVEKLKALLV